MPLTASARSDSESGAILPLFAILIVILFVFAAFAVDLGAAWAERREAQTAADAGVMGAALEYLVATPDEDGIYDLVSSYVNSNLSGTGYTFNDWESCVDVDRPSDYAPLGDSGTWDSPENGLSLDQIDCISVKQPGDEPAVLRVRLPARDMPTAFARVIGIDSIGISAFAEAEIRQSEASDILPFSLPANPTTEECLGTPPSGLLPPEVAPCTGPVSGNFGMLDIWWFGAGDPYDTTAQGCPSKPPFTQRSPQNLAIGIDHPITTWPNTDNNDTTYDGPSVGTNLGNNHPGAESCDSAANDVIPYVIQTETGNTMAVLQDGFFGDGPFGTASNNTPGRLRQVSPIGATISAESDRLTFTTNSDSYTVDNIGLWEYLDQATINSANSTSACGSNAFNGLAGRQLTEQMELCLQETGSKAPRFTDDIINSPRFAVVPKLNYATGAQAGTQWWAVMDMVPVYVQTTWFLCKTPTADCQFEPTGFASPDGRSVFFNPGEGSASPCLPKNGNCNTPKSIEAAGASAFVIDIDWLTDAAKNSLGQGEPYEVYLRR